ncbi:MFS general substrate transporter [Aspergillus brunneoviolaceus CBS 621.78]|uniref:MFS general substrate transporter n=1 Tax=Aspergillus brunneoviolaceus CBS 621.78 TaxID=1450534 RepID=A0ACD1FRY1_9EURO|nr:MFS general substrate transporter [Aspergillus brunneoviolaceus CBS 621.78]RAH39742.1 MFS general substrate transporter [Aspergillus brunneoviolaceus CBS 621.78]
MSETHDSSSTASSLEKGPQPSHPGDAGDSETSHSVEDTSPAAASPPKKQGTKAWLALTGGVLGMFASFGWVNCVAVFQAEYELNQLRDYSSSQVSWISSVLFFFMLGFSPVAGRLYDGHGPRLPIVIGTFLHVFGLMMASLSTKYYQFILSQSVCSGLGTSLIITPSMTAPMTYFHDRRALAGGFAIAGSSLGGVIFPFMVNHLLSSIGFAWTMRACAFLIFGLLLVTCTLISSNATHSPKEFKLSHYLRPLKEVNFLLMCIASFFMYWGMFVPYVFMVISSIHYGMSVTMGYNLIPIQNGVSFFGRTVPQIWARKYGQFNVFILAMVASIVVVLASWLPSRGNAAIIVFTVLFGFVSGTTIGLGPMLVMALSPPTEIGYRVGTVFAVAGLGALTSPPIAGVLITRNGGDYVYAAVFSGVAYAVSTVVMVILRVRIGGWGFLSKV